METQGVTCQKQRFPMRSNEPVAEGTLKTDRATTEIAENTEFGELP
jgi:hypothetical protein